VKFRVDVERRIEARASWRAQDIRCCKDLERGRPMEIDPLVTVVQEMGRLTQIPTPAIDAVWRSYTSAPESLVFIELAERRIYHWNGGWLLRSWGFYRDLLGSFSPPGHNRLWNDLAI